MSSLKHLRPALWFLVIVTLVGSMAQAGVVIGMPEKDLLAEKGPPASKASFKGKAIYTWQDMRVILESGAVVKVEPRDTQKEQASEARRTQLAIAEKKKQEAARKAQEVENQRYVQEQSRRAAAARAESKKESDFDKDRRLRMEKYARDREISGLEEQMRQLDAAANRSWKSGHGDEYVRMKMRYHDVKAERDAAVRKNQR